MLTRQSIERLVTLALEEDAPWGDITTETLIPADATASARLVAREAGVFSGGAVLVGTMLQADSRIRTSVLIEDGASFAAGAVLAEIDGPAGGVLRGERVALNLVQRMSGIATLTAYYVKAVEGTRARIVDTRKTTPGLRAFERHAVRSGGGRNHRSSLSDAILAKDNHLAILAQRGIDLTAALQAARAAVPHTTHIEVEVDRLEQIEPALAGGADTIMLDNFAPEQLRQGVTLIGGRAVVEASGGVNLETVRAIAEAGVDVISVGALTHSVRSLDLGLDIDIEAPAP
ncbi:nicotinate-nucleotide diphosphorylase (carboxylating) [Rathayibacter caricis DSM 15933]|uniref:Nicotinate-nucleotide pyrophosphorylase [carboxylating] n=1 Tax=Rathayibacter caricis DSM 15933 TaxID=1328867 RepID=A0A2T4UV81_9MICO|nr:carboxylating nicotinate-nucleotide diphosphorylase [Rathayibacter caricis]PTL73436.1 nicotinate-nucleotide diphosphorylase (carboxylating) [Rathayibacter caricis DSM 15933]